ncbi:MAG: aminotransferase class V-fold PLP-dependent enzyme [Planctomycetes bacterium]|nr:aminotransferase class V-fold PLP-dependent enzyme [Planctomycetota bacterium]
MRFKSRSTSNKEIKERRKFIKQLGLISAIPFAAPIIKTNWFESIGPYTINASHNKRTVQDESYWENIRKGFVLHPEIINLNNGSTCSHSIDVQNELSQYDRKFNEIPHYMRKTVYEAYAKDELRKKLANLAGCSPEELAICRNTTEALETVIFGLNLEKGDEIITTQLDYPTMLNTLYQREKRDGIVLNKINIPILPKSTDEIVELFSKAISKRTKIILISHMTYVTGQILPVKEICDLAHQHGIDVIVDGAHSFAHIDFKISDLHCDYFGTSLHKWLCAPFGTGLLYVKNDIIKNIWPLFAAPPNFRSDNIRKFEYLGTRSFATELAINSSIDLHNAIGPQTKEKRLRYLKNYWMEKIRNFAGVRLYTSSDEKQSCGIASFSIDGFEYAAIHEQLLNKYNIYTLDLKHTSAQGIRVSPNIYTTLGELDEFVNAIKEITK